MASAPESNLYDVALSHAYAARIRIYLREYEQAEALGVGKHWKKATAEKRKIWRKFLTPGVRSFDWSFIQHDPPHYDPRTIVDSDVRRVTADHVLVEYGQATSPSECTPRILLRAGCGF